ncbi:MAG: PEP-CTERM sorting domain-containing protein [bacterium]|nr:PEP-CTERM sorting domain-containing protein [bacterium]
MLGDWGAFGPENQDLGFRTYVNPIPEPTTALLLTLGLAGLGMRPRGIGRATLAPCASLQPSGGEASGSSDSSCLP